MVDRCEHLVLQLAGPVDVVEREYLAPAADKAFKGKDRGGGRDREKDAKGPSSSDKERLPEKGASPAAD